MNKKEFDKLLKEATTEYHEEQKDRIKSFLKERLQEYELAKATVARIEKQFEKIKKDGYKETLFLE